MQWWESFQQLEYSNELLVIIGGLLLFFGVMKIISSGLKMFFWVVLCGLGAGSVAYGINNKEVDLPFNNTNELSEYLGTGKELSSDMLQLLCTKLNLEET